MNNLSKLAQNFGNLLSGRIAEPTIDIYNRPVVHNSDGSISTVRTMGFEPGEGRYAGRQVNIPTIGLQGQEWTPEQAIDNFYQTGQHLGVYRTPSQATRGAIRLHNQQAGYYKN